MHSALETGISAFSIKKGSIVIMPAHIVTADGDVEKIAVTHLERSVSDDSVAINDARIEALTLEEQKKVIRRIDIRLVLTLGFMYCVSLMDRTNLVSTPQS